MDNRAIGIFDSGLGGLTVLKEINKIMPNENLIYFGDSKRTPYGSKSKETIIKFSIQDVKFLLTKNVKAIVIACNTVSSNAIIELKKQFDIPFIEVIKPGAAYSKKVTKNNKIGVIGTKATIESKAYEHAIKKENDKIDVFSKSCPLLVPLVEEGHKWWNGKITKEIIKYYLDDFTKKDIDTLVLGCTHYPLLIEAINQIVDNKIVLINSAGEVAKKTKLLLENKKLLCKDKKGTLHLYTSDSVLNFIPLAKEILSDDNINVNQIDIEQF